MIHQFNEVQSTDEGCEPLSIGGLIYASRFGNGCKHRISVKSSDLELRLYCLLHCFSAIEYYFSLKEVEEHQFAGMRPVERHRRR